MQEFDLEAIWQQGEEQATEFYHSVKEDVVRIAKQRSNSVLDKVRKIALIEFAVGILLALIALWAFRQQPMIFWPGLVLFTGAGIWSVLLIRRLFNDLRMVNTKEILQAIGQYITLLERYRKRIEWYILLATPIGFIAGFGFGLYASSGNLSAIGGLPVVLFFLLGITLIFGLVYWIRKRYLQWSVGRYIDELKTIRLHLRSEE